MKKLTLIALIPLAGCASSSGIVPMGPDTYYASADGGFGVWSVSERKAKVFREAGEFCAKDGKQFMVVNTREVQMTIGVYPHAEVQFMCLKPGDPQLQRPNMVPTPNNVVEIRTPSNAH